MPRVFKRIDAMRFRFGGESHSGWLPAGSAVPLPTPVEEVILDLTISSEGGGYMLEWQAADGSHYGDTWHEPCEEALQQARYQFGVEPSDWQDTKI